MKRMLIHITKEQHETLRRLSYEQNRTMSEIVREALDKHLGGSKMAKVNGQMVDYDKVEGKRTK